MIKELYRKGSSFGDGGTADAVRHEIKTGEVVGSKSHINKARERSKQIEKILSRNPNHIDKNLLKKLKKDLDNALKGE